MSTRLLKKKNIKNIYRILANRYIYNLIRNIYTYIYSIMNHHQHNKNIEPLNI